MDGNNTPNSMAGGDFPNAPVTMLDVYMPWLGMVSRLVLEPLGFDIKLVVLFYITGSALAKYATLLWTKFVVMLEEYWMPRVSISSFDKMHTYLMDWIEKQPISTTGTKLMVKSTSASLRKPDEEKKDGADYPPAQWPELVNLKTWSAESPPTYQVFYGVHYFRHNGHLFKINRPEPDRYSYSGDNTMTRERWIHLSCIGLTASPVKELLDHCQRVYHANKTKYTTMYRPVKRDRRWKADNLWMVHAKCLSRSLDTVDLDQGKKDKVLKDMNTYLQPQRAQWYADRAIPYRRGYLFHGPPGTGKTTLSFAIAGVFGLDIHCLSLLDPQLAEEDVVSLFVDLPSRCVVLLEDVDSAGLKRDDDSDTDSDDETSKSDSAAEKSKGRKEKKKEKKSQISLSCLLNAIDGVGSQEGRLLIMTTNCPEKLDEALLRPGRVDMRVEFTNASAEQVQQMFLRMFSADRHSAAEESEGAEVIAAEERTAKQPQNEPLKGASSESEEDLLPFDSGLEKKEARDKEISISSVSGSSSSLLDHKTSQGDRLEEAAAAFAATVPIGLFTPAEIQGFLLSTGDDKGPEAVVEEAKVWVEAQLEVKKAAAEKKQRREKKRSK